MEKKNPRIIFLFTNDRAPVLSAVKKGNEPDTALRGLNHIPSARYAKATAPRGGVASFLMWSVAQIPLLFRLFQYNFVIASDAIPLGYVVSVLARVFHRKTRWVYVAMNSSTLMHRHVAHKIRLALLKRMWGSYSRIVCLSHEQMRDFIHLGISRERLVFVPFGIDANFYAVSTNTPVEDLIVSVGRDVGRDYVTLFETAKCLPLRKFVVVSAHRNIPDKTPIPKNVSVYYNLSSAQVRNLYARARIVVVPTKKADLFEGSDCSGQTVILDALAAGKPVIATERAWIKDYFTSDKELLVVPTADPEHFAATIERLWRDDSLRHRCIAAGRKIVYERYTTEAFAQALQKITATL